MKKIIRTAAVLFVLTPTIIFSSGCLAVAAGGAAAGTVAYVRGALEVTVDSPIDHVGTAASQTMDDMKFAVVSNNVDATSGKLIARTAQDKKVQITFEKLTENATKVSIRVGTFGDKLLSQQIYDNLNTKI